MNDPQKAKKPAKKLPPAAPRGAAKWDKPEPHHKARFEQLLEDAIGAKKKAG